MIKKLIFKLIALVAIISSILLLLTPLFAAPGYGMKIREGVYNREEPFDALFLGSSHMNGLLNPDIIQEKCGITSFNYGTGGQPINVTYHLLKEILNNKTTPDLVVLDVYYLGLTTNYGEDSYIRYILDNLELSFNKLEAIMDCVPLEDRLEFLFPVFRYHSRWSGLSEEDYTWLENYDTSINGFAAGDTHYGHDLMSDQSSSEIGEIPEVSKKYLDKIIDLSKEYGFSLILVNAPYDYIGNDHVANWYPDDAALMNGIAEYAAENNIPFINYSSVDKMKEINFDFKEDMNNDGHVNIYGAEKVSLDFANYLNSNDNLK